MRDPLIIPTDEGLYCPAGDFHIDPWRPVPRAVITHAHADHARPGNSEYFSHHAGLPILRHRIIPNFAARSEGMTADTLIEKLVAEIPADEKLLARKTG